MIEQRLEADGTERSSRRLRTLTEEVLTSRRRAGRGATATGSASTELDRPLVLLLAGTTGVGKSTLATMAAHRLGITRVIATDVIRQVLRASFSRDFMPSVHSSAFEVDMEGYPSRRRRSAPGSRRSSSARDEGTPVVVEGVHVAPGMHPTHARKMVLVEAVLVVEDQDLHRAHFEAAGPGRPSATWRASIRSASCRTTSWERALPRSRSNRQRKHRRGARALMDLVLHAVHGLSTEDA